LVSGCKVSGTFLFLVQESIFNRLFILSRVKKHLEPLALAANITQASHCQLDQVLIIFGLLYHKYNILSHDEPDSEDAQLMQAITNSIEK
jgi:hypothetical protein